MRKVRFAHTACRDIARKVEVEPSQAISIQEMLIRYTNGLDIPEIRSNGYDENINIDDIGYAAQDTLEAMDYLNAVNQHIAQIKATEAAKTVETVTETPSADVQ